MCGMTTFGKEEIEILGSKHELPELQRFVLEIVWNVIGSDVALHEGVLLGSNNNLKLPIIRWGGVAVEGETLKISY
ncbi:MAG TPA: DUF4261 domain-containing protein [Candidatus Butyricimonas faecavium]|nr:DUF4261 domain-containing protein [Candidatus Butyricimonas faecavium]